MSESSNPNNCNQTHCDTELGVYSSLENVYIFVYFCLAPMSLMPIVRIQAADSDSCADFVWLDSHFPLHTGAIYAIDSSELVVTEGGYVWFSDNQAVGSGGKYSYPCQRR